MRLLRALQIYLCTQFTWKLAWAQASDQPSFVIAERDDGFEYVEPRPSR